MQWTQDLAGDLDTFARLTRAGHFARAESFYQEVLQVNTHFFPVAAEYCDMLIEQGAFAKAEDFLADNDQSGYDEEEKLVMALLHGIAKIHTQLCFATAASIADKALRYIDVPRADKEWTGIQVSDMCGLIVTTRVDPSRYRYCCSAFVS
jgi:thioredoxin-like negative regulator of GroEL